MTAVSPPETTGRWMRLDRNYTILQAGHASLPIIQENVGHSLWDAFPGSECTWKDVYERAFADGIAAQTIRYNGSIVSVHAVREPDGGLLVATTNVNLVGITEALRLMFEDTGEPPLAYLECRTPGCGLGGTMEQLSPHDWATCHECDQPLTMAGVVHVNEQEIQNTVEDVREHYGDAGLIELACVALSALELVVV